MREKEREKRPTARRGDEKAKTRRNKRNEHSRERREALEKLSPDGGVFFFFFIPSRYRNIRAKINTRAPLDARSYSLREN